MADRSENALEEKEMRAVTTEADAPRVRGFDVRLWPEERAMLRDFATLRAYPTAFTGTMRFLQARGFFSRLEECGPNGTAVVTPEGNRLLDALR